jgi:hypothetical protein
MANQWILPGVVVAVIAVMVGAMVVTQEQQANCPGHWHSSFGIYVDDNRVSYANYNLENGQTQFASHLHQGNDQQMHYERGCIKFSEFLGEVDTSISNDEIKLDGNQNVRGTFKSDGTNETVAFIAQGWGDWEAISVNKVRGMQLADGDRVLIAYGNYTEDEIVAMQSSVTVPPHWAQANPPS